MYDICSMLTKKQKNLLLFINKKTNHSFSIDSRTSDAIAIAIRFNSGIYTHKEILDKSGLQILSASDLNDAAKKIVEAIN